MQAIRNGPRSTRAARQSAREVAAGERVGHQFTAAFDHRRLEDVLLGDGAALEDRGDAAVPQDGDAIGDVDELGQVARIEEDRVALGGEIAHQLEDLALGADVDAAGRIEEEEDASPR